MKGAKLPPSVPGRDDVEAMLDACPDSWLGKRKRAMLVLLYRCGLRCDEVLHVEPADIRLRAPATVWVRKPKNLGRGAPQRTVGLDARTVEILREWLEARGDRPGPLFLTQRGEPVHSSNVRRVLPLLARRGGLTGRVHPHGMRHAFATECYREGMGLIEIQQALGHKSVGTTQTYLQSIGATEVVAATGGRSW